MQESVTGQAPIWKMYRFPAFFAPIFYPQDCRAIMACFLSNSLVKGRALHNLSF